MFSSKCDEYKIYQKEVDVDIINTGKNLVDLIRLNACSSIHPREDQAQRL